MATATQLRALRKKYGLGEFKNKRNAQRARARRSFKSIKQTRRLNMAKKRHHYRKARTGGTLWGNILGVGGFVLYESLVSPKIPINEPIKSIAELGVGLWLSKKSGIVGNVGKAAVVINTYQLMNAYVAPRLASSTSLFN